MPKDGGCLVVVVFMLCLRKGGCRCDGRGRKMSLRCVPLATGTATVHKRSNENKLAMLPAAKQITSSKPPAGGGFYLKVKHRNGRSSSVAASTNQETDKEEKCLIYYFLERQNKCIFGFEGVSSTIAMTSSPL